MANISKHEKPKVTSLERLVELAEQKRAVVFNNGIIKPAAVVVNMQGAVIAGMIRNGNLFEYIKPVSEKKPMTFYRSGKAKRPLYAELDKQNQEMKAVLKEVLILVGEPEKLEDFAEYEEFEAVSLFHAKVLKNIKKLIEGE